MGYEVGIVFMC
jgi:hypothetical protein